MLLNGADIPNLYPADEKATVIEKCQAYVAQNNLEVRYSAIYDQFKFHVLFNL